MLHSSLRLATAVWLALSICLTFDSRALAQTHAWSKRLGGSALDYAEDVYVDGAGNVVIGGHFTSASIDLGGGALVRHGQRDALLAKYDSAGNHLWSRRFGALTVGESDTAEGTGVATDAVGNVYFAGWFVGDIFFTPTSGYWSQGLRDVFLAKFDPSGNTLWSKRLGQLGSDYALDVAVDSSGNVILVGNFTGTIDFGGGNVTAPPGDYYFFVAKYDQDGNYVWAQIQIGNNVYSLAIDAAGAIFVTGDMGPEPTQDIFLTRYSADGELEWSQELGGDAQDSGRAVAVDGAGDLIVTGEFRDTLYFGGGLSATSAGGSDIFLAKYDGATGGVQWGRGFGGINNDLGLALDTDGCGNVLLTGAFRNSLSIDGVVHSSAGNEDVLVAKFDGAAASRIWSRSYGAAGGDRGMNAVFDAAGNVVLSGTFQNTVNFGGSPLTASGLLDIFLARYLDAPDPVASLTAYISKNSTLVPADGNILLGCPAGLDIMVIELDLVDACFGETIAQNRLTMSAPLSDNFELYATHPTDWMADSDARASNGYVVTFSRPYLGGCGVDDIAIYLDGVELGQVSYEVRSVDMVGADATVGLGDFAKFATHYNSCEGGAGDYSSCADFVDDGCVNLSDFAFFSTHYNHTLGSAAKPGTLTEADLEAMLAQLEGSASTQTAHVLQLEQNVPNPFNPRTQIRFTLPSASSVELAIHDVRGQRVRTFYAGELLSPGQHELLWNGDDDHGRSVASGVYWYRLQAAGATLTRQMLLLR